MSTAMAEVDSSTNADDTKKSPFAATSVGDTGISVRNGAEMWSLSCSIARSGLAPKGVETPEAILIALQLGFELGLPPMAALQNIAVINGRPALWGDAVLAVVRATGELEQFTEWYEQGGETLPRNPVEYSDDTVAVCRVKRRGCEPAEVGFSVADAKRASLWDKAGPWKQYPFRMLRQRARGYALRDAFGDALRGLLTEDEVSNLPTVDAVSITRRENDAPASRSESLKDKLRGQVNGKESALPQAATQPQQEPAETPAQSTAAEPQSTGLEEHSEAELREMLTYASTPKSLQELKSAVMESSVPRGVKVELCNEISERMEILKHEAENAG